MQWYERLDEKLRDYLPDMTVEHDVPMSRHTSFRIGVRPGAWPFRKAGSSW